MKETIFTLTLLLSLSIVNNAKAQAIEIIDAIAGTLIPGITKGVKEVIETNKSKEKKKEEVDNVVKTAQKELVNSLNDEIENINTIRTIYSESRKANSAAGALKALTNKFLIQYAKDTDVIETKRQIALLYTQEWNSLNASLTAIKAISINSLDANLQQTLTSEKDRINDALNRVSTLNGFNSGNLSWTGALTLEQANERITTIEQSTDHITRLQDGIEQIARVIDTRLQTYKLSFEKLKKTFE